LSLRRTDFEIFDLTLKPGLGVTQGHRSRHGSIRPVEKHSSQHVLPCRICSLYVKRLVRNYEDPPEKFDPSRPALQGHSRSLEPTRIDRLPMTSYYCSIVIVGLSEPYSDKGQFNAPAEGFRLEFCSGCRVQTAGMIPLPDRQKV